MTEQNRIAKHLTNGNGNGKKGKKQKPMKTIDLLQDLYGNRIRYFRVFWEALDFLKLDECLFLFGLCNIKDMKQKEGKVESTTITNLENYKGANAKWLIEKIKKNPEMGEGWFRCSEWAIRNNLHITKRVEVRVLQSLKKKNLIHTVAIGMPAKRYMRINYRRLHKLILRAAEKRKIRIKEWEESKDHPGFFNGNGSEHEEQL